MARGAEDYSNIKKSGDIFRVDDMGELAVRLGSTVSFNRRGEVLFIEDFKYGLGGITYALLPAYRVVTLDNTDWYFNPYSCNVEFTGLGASSCSLQKIIGRVETEKIGISWAYKIDNKNIRVRLDFQAIYSEVNYNAILIIRPDLDDIGLYIPGLTWTTVVENLNMSYWLNRYIFVKLVIDVENKIYDHLIVDDIYYDLRDYELYYQSYLPYDHFVCTIQPETTSGIAGNFNLDHIIITRNE